jgi:VanZ family protein
VLFFYIPEQLKDFFINKIQIDTVGHVIGFFGLTWLLVGLIKLPLLNTVMCLYFYSALTELSQYYLGFRNGEFVDVVADVIGVSLFAICHWLHALYHKPQGMNN